jgi:hypothetical protein
MLPRKNTVKYTSQFCTIKPVSIAYQLDQRRGDREAGRVEAIKLNKGMATFIRLNGALSFRLYKYIY